MDASPRSSRGVEQNDIDTSSHATVTPTASKSIRRLLTRRLSSYMSTASLSVTAEQHARSGSLTSSSSSSAASPLSASADAAHFSEKSTSGRLPSLARARSITMPSFPQQFSLTGERKIFGRSDKKCQSESCPSETHRRSSTASSNGGLRNVVSGFMRKKNTAPSISERSDASECSLHEATSGGGTAGMPEKRSKTARKLRRRKVALEADKRTSIMVERDNRGWDVDVLFTEADAALKRLKTRTSLDSAAILSPVVTAALRDLPSAQEDMAVDEPVAPAGNASPPSSPSPEPNQHDDAGRHSMADSWDSEPASSMAETTATAMLPDIAATSPDQEAPEDRAHNEADHDTASEVPMAGELSIATDGIDDPCTTTPLHLTASPETESPSAPDSGLFGLSRPERNRRSQLSITRTRSGRLRLSPASSVAVTALHAEPVVSVGRATAIVDEHGMEPSSRQSPSRSAGRDTCQHDVQDAQTVSRRSRSGDLLRALATQSGSVPAPMDRSRQARPRAYTASAATGSRPVSFAHESDAGSIRRRPQPAGRSWRIFSWFVRGRETDDSLAVSGDLHAGSGGSTGAHTVADASLVAGMAGGNARRRQPPRPSIRSIWPGNDGFGQPPHILRQKVESISSASGSMDLQRHLLRPWSAVEPMQSVAVKLPEHSAPIGRLPDGGEARRTAATIGMQPSVLAGKKSIPTLATARRRPNSGSGSSHPRPLSSPSLLYGGDLTSRWREIAPTLADLHRGKAGLSKSARHSLATLRARLSATRLALIIAASPRSSGNASMYRYSDLYPQSVHGSRSDKHVDPARQQQQQQQQQQHPLPSKHDRGHQRWSSPYEATSTAPDGLLQFSTTRSLGSARFSPTVEAASLRFSGAGRRRRSELRHPTRYRDSRTSETALVDAASPTTSAPPDAYAVPPNTITRQLLRKSNAASMPSHTSKPASAFDPEPASIGSSGHKMQLIAPSLADELRMLIIGSWRRGFFNTGASSLFGHNALAAPGGAGSARRQSIRRRRPRAGPLRPSRPVSNVSVLSCTSSNADGRPQSDCGTLVQMEHFEGFDGVL